MVMVTGAGPQSKVIFPPAATAATTAAEVQLAGVPLPTTRSGRRVSTARASAGTSAPPPALPGLGRDLGRFEADGLGAAEDEGEAEAEADGGAGTEAGADDDPAAAGATKAGSGAGLSSAQPDNARVQVTMRGKASGKRTARE
jgi:hypothetical protein